MSAYDDLAALVAARDAYATAEAAARAAETAYRNALAVVQADIAAAGMPITANISGTQYSASLSAGVVHVQPVAVVEDT